MSLKFRKEQFVFTEHGKWDFYPDCWRLDLHRECTWAPNLSFGPAEGQFLSLFYGVFVPLCPPHTVPLCMCVCVCVHGMMYNAKTDLPGFFALTLGRFDRCTQTCVFIVTVCVCHCINNKLNSPLK